jgi:hypothetical protein
MKYVKKHGGWDWVVEKVTVAFWARVAHRLAIKGTLPTSGDLRKNGYYGLEQAVRKHPELFEGLQLRKTMKGAEGWVPVAESLAKKHGGTLPGRGWLQKHGYGALTRHLMLYPKFFRHIKQKAYFADIQTHVSTAKRLEQEHGRVPHYCWLVEKGYGAIYQAKRKHPEMFKGISWGQKRSVDAEILAERVIQAQRLAKDHGGRLPAKNWLSEHGHRRLVRTMKRYPEMFVEVPQKQVTQFHTVDEWVQIAAKLARENHGKIPGCTRLYSMNMSGLYRALRTHPEKFRRWDIERG